MPENSAILGIVTRDYIYLSHEISVKEAYAKMHQSHSVFCITLDQEKEFCGLVSEDDLGRLIGDGISDVPLMVAGRWLPGWIMMPQSSSLQSLVNAPQLSFLIHRAVSGIIVGDYLQPIGIVSAEVALSYIDQEHNKNLLLDQEPDQLLSSPLDALHCRSTLSAFVVCSRCQKQNELQFLDPTRLPWCINRIEPVPGPHKLELDWL